VQRLNTIIGDLEGEETQRIREKCMKEGMATQNTQIKKPFPHNGFEHYLLITSYHETFS
jgi:hypothetical protein